MDLCLVGRVAVVTGSSQGMGRATALLFGSEGARVTVTYHRERDRAMTVVDEIENGGSEAVATELDLASTGSVSRTVGSALGGGVARGPTPQSPARSSESTAEQRLGAPRW